MSKIEVNTVEPQCGTTLTLGGSGDTVALGSGASQTGFGRTGTVDWVTTIKTNSDSPITAVSGKGYFLNTTAEVITINLPSSPSAGDIVSIKDYARTFGTNAVTVGRGGSNMDGNALDTTLDTSGSSVTFIYMDATKGWSFINEEATTMAGAAFVAACGGNATATCGDYKIHTFTGPGTFTVSCAGNAGGSNTVDYLVVAGGGGAGKGWGGGGGGGGYRESVPSCTAWTSSPLGNPGNARPVTATGYPITVGSGGAVGATNNPGSQGATSTFSDISSAGGGYGGGAAHGAPGGNGGSGGAGGGPATGCGGSGNTPPVSPPQGQDGGDAPGTSAGGGGGATAAAATNPPNAGGAGAGTALQPSQSYGSPGPDGQLRYFAGGGGGGAPGGVGGGGNACTSGTVNTGGGGGTDAGSGGSGIVILRYKSQ